MSGRLLADEAAIEKLEVPALNKGRIPEYLKANMLTARNVTDRPVFAGCIGPYSLAGRLYDMSEIMMLIYINPDAANTLLRKCSDFITRYCYSDEERVKAIEELGPDPEITRFKGLGEISPDEFVNFIGPDMRLEQVTLHKTDQVQKLLEYYMGKNTPERQNFIIDNLVIEEDRPEEEEKF